MNYVHPLLALSCSQLDGHTVPKGTQCLPSVYLLHRNSDAWGPRAADWVPERWFAGAETDLAPRGEGPAVFVPFGSRTSRALVGQEVAMPAVRAILAHVLSHCDVGTGEWRSWHTRRASRISSGVCVSDSGACCRLPLASLADTQVH